MCLPSSGTPYALPLQGPGASLQSGAPRSFETNHLSLSVYRYVLDKIRIRMYAGTMKATLYIPESKAELYEKAKATLGESISATFVKCLERELQAFETAPGRIVVSLRDRYGRHRTKAFEGVWLVGGPEPKDGETHHFDSDATGVYGHSISSVARTKAGRIVVVTWDENSGDTFTIHQDFEEFREAKHDNRYPAYPASLVSVVGSELGSDNIEELDI